MEITSGSVQIAAESGNMSAWLCRPKAAGNFAAVVVVMEAFGLNGHIKDVAERIAREGYITLAPDMYYRDKDAVVGYDNLPDAIRLMSGLYDEKIVKDMAAAIKFVQGQPQVRGDRIGVTGFCMGGRITFLTACRNPAVTAAAPFYGGGIGSVMQPGERTPKAPLDYADQLSAPMLLFFGGEDPFIPNEEVDRIKSRLAELGKDAETIVYPGAPHGFFCNERDSYRPEAAKDSWQRLLQFFGKHLNR
ncbi:MAG TPA: dienelactone hydrolase family protein [Candidatus Acidoferrales bacterium]|nr:dienelactone hydrolase family protein [Candidatus Acidoferrales bacterium]